MPLKVKAAHLTSKYVGQDNAFPIQFITSQLWICGADDFTRDQAVFTARRTLCNLRWASKRQTIHFEGRSSLRDCLRSKRAVCSLVVCNLPLHLSKQGFCRSCYHLSCRRHVLICQDVRQIELELL